MPFDRTTTLTTPTGATLRLHACAAEGAERGVVQVNHGLSEHAGRYGRFARFLAAHGFHTYAQDHRGHGQTTAPGAPRGAFGPEPAAEKVLADVLCVHEHLAREHPGLPVILFGHSMGGMIALALLARHAVPVAGAAVWNAPVVPALQARAAKAVLAWERFRLGSDVPSRLLPHLTFRAWAKAVPEARTPFDWLSRDRAAVDAFIADPLCGWDPTVGLWRAVFDFNLAAMAPNAFAALSRDLPVQLVGGGSDPSTGCAQAVKRIESRLRAQGFSNLETRIYAENRHESLNELNRDTVMRDFLAWAVRATDQGAARPDPAGT